MDATLSTLEEMIEDWDEQALRFLGPQTRLVYLGRVTRFIDWGGWAHPEQVTRRRVQRYFGELFGM